MSRIRKHFKSYVYAVRGILIAFKYESNFVVHFIAAVAVLTVNVLLNIDRTAWLITLILIGLAWTAEIFNTAIEKLADRVNLEHDPLIGDVKDLASGAVLTISCFAVICAVIIYLPYLVKLFAH